MKKRKFVVTWVRISHLAEDIEVLAENREEAKQLASRLFSGGKEVHAEEFCNGIECEEDDDDDDDDDDDTYDAFGVNIKNSFNTPPKGAV